PPGTPHGTRWYLVAASSPVPLGYLLGAPGGARGSGGGIPRGMGGPPSPPYVHGTHDSLVSWWPGAYSHLARTGGTSRLSGRRAGAGTRDDADGGEVARERGGTRGTERPRHFLSVCRCGRAARPRIQRMVQHRASAGIAGGARHPRGGPVSGGEGWPQI